MRKLLFALLTVLGIAAASAAELRPFGQGEMARLLAEHQGRPFALTLWGLDCPYCKGTLRQLAVLARTHPTIDVVVVSTDTPGESKAIAAMLATTGLAKRDTWVFGDEAAERLRYEIDRRWAGEMPRTYLFDRDHKVTAFSGPLADGVLKQWLSRNLGR